MTRQYQMRDAEQWAAFSGDKNPIHFSLAAARQLGLDALCIHGMRVMLDIKAGLGAQGRLARPRGQNLLFSCRLDKPIFYQRDYVLEAEQISRNEKVQLRSHLRDAINQERCLNGKLVAELGLMQLLAGEDGQVSPREMIIAAQQLARMTGQKLELWNVMDAMLFKQLIHSPATMCRVRDELPEIDCTDLMAVFNPIQMVQTHHESSFSPSLLIASDISLEDDPLRFSILPAQVVGKSHSGFILRVSIQAFKGEKALMRTTVTLKATLSYVK